MTPKSDFRYEIHDGGSLYIEDLNLGRMSVTNDMENVLEAIYAELGSLPVKITYKDSDGNVDGVKYINGNVSFYSVK